MKKLFLMAAVLFSVAVSAQEKKVDDLVKLNAEKYDFGKIKKDIPVTTYFELTNTTNAPVIIESVTASCGCTTPEWSKEPLAAGKSTKIKVGYNAAALNTFTKEIYIKLAGVSQTKIVKISGDVLEPAAYETYVKGAKKGDAGKVQTSTKNASKKTKTTSKTNKTTAKAG